MGSRRFTLEAEVPVVLTRADYDRTRKAFYLATGMARDDALLPKLCPPGAVVVKTTTQLRRIAWDEYSDTYERVAGAPATDVCVPREHLVDLFEWQGSADGLARSSEPFQFWGGTFYARIDYPADRTIAADGPYRKPYSTPGGYMLPGSSRSGPGPEFLDPVAEGAYRSAAGLANGAVRKADAPPFSDEWWYETDWGREAVVTFVPPLVKTQWGWERAVLHELPEGSEVLVRAPHRYIVGMPDGRGTAGRCDTLTFGTDPQCTSFTRIRSSVVLTAAPSGRHWHGPSLTPDGYIALYEVGDKAEWWEAALSYVARSVALRGVVLAIGAVVSAGAAAPLIQAGLTAAKNMGLLTDFEQTVDTAVGVTVDSLAPPAAGQTVVQQAVEVAAESVAPATVITPATAPEETAQLIAEAAELTVYFVGLDSLPGLGFRELAIQGQVTKKKRDELRFELAQKAAELEAWGGEWLEIGKYAVQAIQAAVIGFFTMGTGTALLTAAEAAALAAMKAAYGLAQFGISAAEVAMQMVNGIELARVVKERQKAGLDAMLTDEQQKLADLARREAELAYEVAKLERDAAAYEAMLANELAAYEAAADRLEEQAALDAAAEAALQQEIAYQVELQQSIDAQTATWHVHGQPAATAPDAQPAQRSRGRDALVVAGLFLLKVLL